MIRKFLAQHTVFTLAEFNSYLDSQGTVNKHTQTSLLNYHLTKGNIVRIKRALFATVPELYDPETLPIDPFIIAAKLVPDAILAYHTALEMHGVAYSTFHKFTFLTAQKSQPFEFRNQDFQALQSPKPLRDLHQQMFACQHLTRSGIDINLTSLERTFVDLIDKPDLGGGWEEIISSFDMIAVMNIDLVIEYTLLLSTASIVSKVGYFLELCQQKLGVTEAHLEKLETHASTSKFYLERSARESGKLISRWNLVVPDHIINRSWDELS